MSIAITTREEIISLDYRSYCETYDIMDRLQSNIYKRLTFEEYKKKKYSIEEEID